MNTKNAMGKKKCCRTWCKCYYLSLCIAFVLCLFLMRRLGASKQALIYRVLKYPCLMSRALCNRNALFSVFLAMNTSKLGSCFTVSQRITISCKSMQCIFSTRSKTSQVDAMHHRCKFQQRCKSTSEKKSKESRQKGKRWCCCC